MLSKIKFIILFLLFTVPVLTFAQTGKIVGKVIDLETGEPLIGANVLVEGTSLGAATDASGDFIILNVTPATYTIKARYIGYREQIVQNIKVSVNLTTEVNFALPSEEYQTETIVVVAPKPLVNKNITNSTQVVKGEDIENLPIRGVAGVVATQAGVVTQGGNTFVRGSRSDAVAYYVDGVLVNNPVFGGAQSGVINNAIEEIQVQAGGYSAEYGGANGGIISTQTRSGTEKYRLTFEGIIDGIPGMEVGDKWLGSRTYGYNELVLTAGGPVFPSYKKLKFFVAGNNTFQRSPAAYYEGLNFVGIFDPRSGALADTFDLVYPDGYVVNDQSNTYQIQGNVTWDLNAFKVRVNGNFRRNDGRNGAARTQLVRQNSAGLHEANTFSGSVKLTHVLSNYSFYDVILSYFDDFSVDMDPYFKHNITAYGDSILNANLWGNGIGRELKSDGQTLNPINAFGFSFARNESPYNLYQKQRTNRIGGKVNFLYQLGKHHEFKTGGEFDYYTIRRYSLGSPLSIADLQKSIADGSRYDIYNRVDNYGYDVFGNVTDSGLEKAKNPVFAAYYIMDKMEFSDLVLNLGFRLDYIDIDGQVFKDPSRVQLTDDGQIEPTSLVDVEPILQVSPRIGFSFPVTDKTVFHAQYGKFIQQSRLRDVYQGYNLIADNIRGGFAISSPVGFGLRPERTTSYEIGFKQQFGDVFAFDITGFYKDIKDQVQIRPIFAAADANHRQYYAWVNGDFSTVKGLEFKVDLRRTERVAVQLDYTYSDAQGTGSNPSSAFRSIWQSPTATPYYPEQISPLDFNQSHRGFLNIDYRYSNDDGPELFGSKILQNAGINMLFSFNSGFNFTRWDGYNNTRVPSEPLNASTTPWTFQLDLKVDKTFNFGDLSFNIYAWVVNVLDIKNVVSVYNTTGDPYDDGSLADGPARDQYDGYKFNYGQQWADLYADLYRAVNYASGNFGTPRQIRLGVRLTY